MPTNLKGWAHRLSGELERDGLVGVAVWVNKKTGNVIVSDGKRGFCITRLCCETWPHLKIWLDVKSALEDLKQGAIMSRTGIKFFPTEHRR